MSKPALATVFANLAIASMLLTGSAPKVLRKQRSEFTRQAEFDAEGNIYVSSSLIEKLAEPSDEKLLPQWAKGQAQIHDESVPMSAALTQERTKWIAKVLRQIGKIKPGMRRRDLLSEFTIEGGLSNRLQRTYVHVECPYIKVNVRFKAISGDHNVMEENADDLIESISQPYLAWSAMD